MMRKQNDSQLQPDTHISSSLFFNLRMSWHGLRINTVCKLAVAMAGVKLKHLLAIYYSRDIKLCYESFYKIG
jgi:hypothetical protein